MPTPINRKNRQHVSATRSPLIGTSTAWREHPLVRGVVVVALLYAFLVAVNGLGAGFRALGEDVLDSFFAATENPFVGLMIGILATTLMQSSSVTTAMIVGLVAAPENPIPIANAVPLIMGANIGTTVTNTIASLAHMGRKEEFRRAFSVATVHDFFNYLAVIVLLPLEMATGYLQRLAVAMTSMLAGVGGGDYDSPIKNAIKAGSVPIEAALGALLPTERMAAVFYVLLSGALIFATLLGIVAVMRASMRSHMESLVSRALIRHASVAMIVGAVVTVMVQSSSITTSLLVPLAGAGVLKLEQAFPVTLGANIGTTVTALFAALAATDINASAGLTIALVHLLFNLSGTLLIYPFAPIRRIPMLLARKLADVAVESKALAIAYVIGLFYVIPVVFAILNETLG
jgi:sodium-dependent phosphate cotransporter